VWKYVNNRDTSENGQEWPFMITRDKAWLRVSMGDNVKRAIKYNLELNLLNKL
jgi:hypothetical protein